MRFLDSQIPDAPWVRWADNEGERYAMNDRDLSDEDESDDEEELEEEVEVEEELFVAEGKEHGK